MFDYQNGDHFEGHWIEDKKEGQGVHFYYDKEKKAHTKRCAHPLSGAALELGWTMLFIIVLFDS